MSIHAAGASSGLPGLPVVNQSLEPAWVRHGSASTQRDYATALGFERVLVEQLTKSLASTAGLGGEGGEGGGEGGESPTQGGGSGTADAGSGQLSSHVPQALSASVMGAGGLGLAAQLTHEMEGIHPAQRLTPGGGTAA